MSEVCGSNAIGFPTIKERLEYEMVTAMIKADLDAFMDGRPSIIGDVISKGTPIPRN